MSLPNDPVMLLSAVNMKLRDTYPDLEELCRAEGIDSEELVAKLEAIDYHYQADINQFK